MSGRILNAGGDAMTCARCTGRVVPAPAPPAKVFIAHVMETMRSSEVLGVFATRDAAVARARENGGWVTEHEVQP